MVLNKDVSLIILTKNEARTIGQVIEKSQKYVNEILVIDGHSADDSKEVAKNLGAKVFIDNGRGKGAAIRLGIEKAKGEILVFIDADGSHEPNDLLALIKPIMEGKADLVIASRGKGGSDELHGNLEKTIRLIGSAIITLCINIRFKADLTDSQNGFRAIKRKVVRKLKLTEDIFTIEQEMLIKALKKGYRVMEVASHEYERKYGRSRIKLLTMSWRYIWCLIKNII